MTNDKELRELDADVAVKVFGWIRNGTTFADVLIMPGPKALNAIVPHYSTDPAAAMEVLKKIHEKACVTTWSNSHFHFCQLGTGEDLVKAQTLELAICRFARKLFGQEDK